MAFSLQFDGHWRFASPGPAPRELVAELFALAAKIASQGNSRQSILEHFKDYFAGAAGTISNRSSSEGWAASDLDQYMRSAAENAPLFIEAFYEACEGLKNRGLHVPDVGYINLVLEKTKADYRLDLPNLIFVGTGHEPVAVEPPSATLDEQAQHIIQTSLQNSQDYLTAGKHREAVQEIIWLLESVATLFQGLPFGNDTITGKYFNVIADELRDASKGTVMNLSLTHAKTLHGYLSSPTGGGVRHGTNLREGVVLTENEARLFCNLIRSYITFLLNEHKRIASE